MGPLGELSRSIKGKVAIVTGAASGMGRATAHLFSDEGALVALCDVNQTGLERTFNEIKDSGGTANRYVIDLQRREAATELVDQVRYDLGPIDILVNNAGIIELPGSFSGNTSSPKPHLGPEPNNLISLAILNRLAADVLSAPDISTIAS